MGGQLITKSSYCRVVCDGVSVHTELEYRIYIPYTINDS